MSEYDALLATVRSLRDMSGWPDNPQIEHGIEKRLLHHEIDMCVPPLTIAPRLVMIHPVACGCDALPDEIVLHG